MISGLFGQVELDRDASADRQLREPAEVQISVATDEQHVQRLTIRRNTSHTGGSRRRGVSLRGDVVITGGSSETLVILKVRIPGVVGPCIRGGRDLQPSGRPSPEENRMGFTIPSENPARAGNSACQCCLLVELSPARPARSEPGTRGMGHGFLGSHHLVGCSDRRAHANDHDRLDRCSSRHAARPATRDLARPGDTREGQSEVFARPQAEVR